MKYKLIAYELPESKYKKFISLCVSLNIEIISNYEKESFFSDDKIYIVVKIKDSNELPLNLKYEKLNETFGVYLQEDEDN